MRLTALALLAVVFATACGPRTMQARMRDAERYADKAGAALDDAQHAADALEPKKLEEALDRAKDALSEKDIELHPEASMHQERYKELAAKVPQVKAAREKKDLEAKLDAARDRIVPRVQALSDAVEALSPTAPTSAQAQAIATAAEQVREAVDDVKGLLEKDPDFAAWAKSQRGKVDRALDTAAKAKKTIAILEGPVAAWTAAQGLQTELKDKKLKAPADREPVLAKLEERLLACDTSATPLAAETVAVPVAGAPKPQTAAQVQTSCRTALKPVQVELKKVRDALAKAAAAKAKPAPKKK